MNVNVILYDDFETMDAFGPVEVFGRSPKHFHINYLSVRGGIVNSCHGVKVWTEILIPEEIEDIVIIPGGKGSRKLLCLDESSLKIIKSSVTESHICMMIGSGSSILAQTGLLYHRRIAEYEGDENWKRMFTAGIERISGCRWMADGKYYSCATTTASIDMSLAVISDMVDINVAEEITKDMGYQWSPESEW